MASATTNWATIDTDRLVTLYGTLRNADLRRELGLAPRLRRLGRCRLQGILYNLGSYPALAEGKGVVHGEVFEVLYRDAFAIMDKFEEYDPKKPKLSAYLRVRVTLTVPDLVCWIYRYNRSLRGVPRVLGGDWVKHRGLRRHPPLPRPL
jgi:gamma-glutamylcyclotransferase (GGCT)/AIG2-like uncharacterized protein YtfP